MRILIVEDYTPLRRSLVRGLREAGYVVEATGDGNEGQWYLAEFEFDLLVLDLMLPGLDGFSILKWLRAKGRPTRVLVLTARGTVDDKVRGLDLGADDYLAKPFAFAELLARVNALSRRHQDLTSETVVLDNLELDTRARVVRVGGTCVDFTPKEYALLELLVQRRGRVLSRDQIWDQLYDFNAENNSNVIDVFIRAIRRKLAAAGAPPLIITRRGFGYTIEKNS